MPDRDAKHDQDPFFQFINGTLDLDGIDGVCVETVALAMREVIQSLPGDDGQDPWSNRLDRLQQTLRMCLNFEAAGRLFQEHPHLTEMNPRDLEAIMMLSITLAYVAYNELSDRLGFRAPREQADLTRLWVTLRSAKGWVDKAAAQGDLVAGQLSLDAARLLEETRPAGWANHTRTLPE